MTIFTANDFRMRAERFAAPLTDALKLGENEDFSRGDHDLNPDLNIHLGARKGMRPASVLIGVVDRTPTPTVLLTMRAETLSSHAGQIAFPGGRADASDASPIHTALREAQEEIGLTPEQVTPVGLLDAYRTGSGYRIVPVLALVAPDMILKTDASEVADVFEVPLDFLMTDANHQRRAAIWQGKRREFYAMPYGDRYIWGATAGILRIMYERLYAE